MDVKEKDNYKKKKYYLAAFLFATLTIIALLFISSESPLGEAVCW